MGKRPTQATQSTLKARNVVMQFLRDCASFCADIGGSTGYAAGASTGCPASGPPPKPRTRLPAIVHFSSAELFKIRAPPTRREALKIYKPLKVR